jgi:membrane associated rhomboid family serine protease
MLLPLKDDNPSARTPYVTYGLIAINLAVMLWMSQYSSIEEHVAFAEYGFIPARIAQLGDPNLVVNVPLDTEPPGRERQRFLPVGRPVQVQVVRLEPVRGQIMATIITTMFLHAGWLHVLGNMWFLWIFGNNVEDRLGPFLFLPFYLVGGLLATACHWAYDPHSTIPVIGASGAVATVLGAYAVTFPKASVRTLVFLGVITIINVPALLWLGLWFGGQLFNAFFLDKDLTVAVWAHIGGFVAGAFLMPILSFGSPPPGSSWEEELKKHFSFTPPDRN